MHHTKECEETLGIEIKYVNTLDQQSNKDELMATEIQRLINLSTESVEMSQNLKDQLSDVL